MRDVACIMAYYESPDMLARQLEAIPKERWSLVVVDDGSPTKPARIPADPRLSLFRVLRDVAWNLEGARNIGVHEAAADWLLITDIDHIVPADTARALVEGDHREDTVYTFTRERAGKRYHPHPNSFFLHRRLFGRIGGFDERLAGVYGGSGEWRGRADRKARLEELALRLVFIGPEEIADAQAPLPRASKENTAARKAILQDLYPPPVTMSFDYEEVR